MPPSRMPLSAASTRKIGSITGPRTPSHEVLLGQLGGAALHLDAPHLEQVRAVHQLQHLPHVLLDDQDRVALGADAADQVEEPQHHDRGQAHRGLVEQDQAGPRHQRAPDGQHLLLAAREAARPLRRPLRQHGEERVDALQALAIARAGGGQVRAHLEVVGHASASGRAGGPRARGRCRGPRCRAPGARPARRPRRSACPCAAAITPEITRKSVVLPAPLGPTTATASPRSTRRATSHSAVKAP